MDQFKGYCEQIELHSADRLIVHKADDSMILANRRIAHWRDYMDSLAAWNALTANAHP